MNISFTINGKQIQCKATETFGDIFDEYVKAGKFQDKVWKINGTLRSNILKNTKLNTQIQGNEVIECLDKSQSNQVVQPQPPIFNQPIQNSQANFISAPPQSPFVNQPQSPFVQSNQQAPKVNQPQPPFNQSQPVFNQPQPQNPQNQGPTQPTTKFSIDALKNEANKMIVNKPKIQRLLIDDTTGKKETEVKTIKGYKVQIKEFGKIVTLESEDGSFKATFLEENAQESEQDNIILSFNDIVQSPETQLKLPMGKDQSKSTKVLFLSGFKGIAIKWVTGLQTKFQFWLDE